LVDICYPRHEECPWRQVARPNVMMWLPTMQPLKPAKLWVGVSRSRQAAEYGFDPDRMWSLATRGLKGRGPQAPLPGCATSRSVRRQIRSLKVVGRVPEERKIIVNAPSRMLPMVPRKPRTRLTVDSVQVPVGIPTKFLYHIPLQYRGENVAN
jgi:hypothetical protein